MPHNASPLSVQVWPASALFPVQCETTQHKLLLKDKMAETYFNFFLKQKLHTKSKLNFT